MCKMLYVMAVALVVLPACSSEGSTDEQTGASVAEAVMAA